MREISKAIQEGAQAYLIRQYSVVAADIGVVIAVALIFVVSFKAAVLFLIGAVLSGSRRLHRDISVRANLRTAEAARGGINPALKMAFRRLGHRAVVVGFGLIGNGRLRVLRRLHGHHRLCLRCLSLFLGVDPARRRHHRRPPMSAPTWRKIELGIPEDDPRNPAVIADNVGDNVGDLRGHGDLFETYAVTAVATMLLGSLLYRNSSGRRLLFVSYPLTAASIIATLIGFALRPASGSWARLPRSRGVRP